MTRTYGWSLLGLAAVLQGCVMPPPPPPPPPPPHHHEHRPPPPEFVRACEGQQEGAAVQLTGRNGEPLTGTCQRAPDGRLVFMPPPPPQR
ncbi:hypothetical protein VAR608DRAFT_3949 [Variovorax sp. HW608]|uniref:hypothetical protein n=1 Tax=Variovorax sp. HW608 TaxID=1034889 RepID=UPI00081FC646|nr:hypothetical protein [Variovorax sp. HW608]SCK41432.1 hypothetical protein VAR608DRAFT_3949 [Variovorax sp. HW608]